MKMTNSCYIIAEAGVNHNGRVQLAKELIDAALAAGADAVKFQSFRTSSLVTHEAKKVGYQAETTEGQDDQYSMLESLELSEDEQIALFAHGRERGIDIFSTAFDLGSLSFLGKLFPPCFKVPSGEVTNVPLLLEIGALGKPVILSTGMATLGETEFAIQTLEESGLPRNLLTVLHCSTQYPTPMQDVNLRAMLTLKEAFPGVRVGYSDHTQGIEISIAAAALGAEVIEKHFTLDRTMAGPDHRASLEPVEFSKMVEGIRNVKKALGDGIKRPTKEELLNRVGVRKSIVASCSIAKGSIFTKDNLTTKRPENGISADRWNELLGRAAGRNYMMNDLIEW